MKPVFAVHLRLVLQTFTDTLSQSLLLLASLTRAVRRNWLAKDAQRTPDKQM